MRAASNPFAQMPTQIFWHHAGGTKKLWNLLFPRIYLEKKKKAQGQSTLKVHQDCLTVGDLSPSWIWQLRVENGKEIHLAPFQESTRS